MSVSPDMATMTTTATEMSSLPRRLGSPPLAPPSGPLPALPVAKTRSSLPTASDYTNDAQSRTSSSPSSPPTSGLPTPTRRSVTVSGLPTPKSTIPRSIPAVPSLNFSPSASQLSTSPTSPSSAIPTPARTIRKTTSFSSFPLPPKAAPRAPSLPPSPLSTSTSLSDINAAAQKSAATKHRSAESGIKKPKTRSSGYGVRTRVSAPRLSGSPSLLNGTGESNLISGVKSARGSESLLSLPSPPQSRASSANGSYMADSGAYEDLGDSPPERGRRKSKASSIGGSKRISAGNDSSKGNVLVSVRVRPDSGEGENPQGEWMVDGKRSLISYSGREGGDYRYDNVYAPHDTNGRVYDSAAKRLVRRVMEGYHGTVFAYGMTGTGKTFSMQGTANSPGVIPLAITDIFSYIRENPAREFLLRVSYLEIYNEKIYDLLNQSTPGQTQQEEIKLREDARRGVYATPLKEEIVQSPNQLLRVIARGDVARRTSSTQFNSRSSRSHAVVQIVVESRERTSNAPEYFEKEARRSDRILPGGVLVSTLSLIDLAGSEKAADSKERRTEGSHINKSLLTLGTVIARLSGDDEKEKGGEASKEKSVKHLPYRDSKLTRLLQPALSGDSLVSILCTVQLSSAGTSATTASSHTGETLNTLKFASRAKNNIVSRAKKNESMAAGSDAKSQALLDRYRIEIQELRAQLDQQNKSKDEAELVELPDEVQEEMKVEEEMERQDKIRHEEQMLEMQLARTALKERISHLNRLILSSKSIGVNSGRFSSASTINPRLSTISGNEYGRPVSLRSRSSMHSDKRDSTSTLEVPMPEGPGLNRTLSSGSITLGILPSAHSSRMMLDDTPTVDEEDEEESGEPADMDSDGNATLARQNRMLQADLADKNRYIATLEKRLLQVRRTSNGRTSMGIAHRVMSPPLAEETEAEQALEEKDRQIFDLRARLDDQTRMVNALRTAARKMESLDKSPLLNSNHNSGESSNPSSTAGEDHSPAIMQTATAVGITTNTATTMPPPPVPTSAPRQISPRNSGNQQRLSNGSRTSNSSVMNFSKTPLSPVNMPLAPPPPATIDRRPVSMDSVAAGPRPTSEPQNVSGATSPVAAKVLHRRKSVDEMTMLLDQMIQEKVESGHVIHGRTGSLRIVKRDTVMERAGRGQEKNEEADVVGGAEEEEPNVI